LEKKKTTKTQKQKKWTFILFHSLMSEV